MVYTSQWDQDASEFGLRCKPTSRHLFRNDHLCILEFQQYLLNRHLIRFFDCLAHLNLSATLATDQKMTLKLSSYLLPTFSRAPMTIVLISRISTMVKGTLLNFFKRYEDSLRVIFYQWPKLHLGLDAFKNQKIFNDLTSLRQN